MKLPSTAAQTARDTVIFFFALAGLIFETAVAKDVNPTLVTGFFGLLGLPLFIRGDEARRKSKGALPEPIRERVSVTSAEEPP